MIEESSLRDKLLILDDNEKRIKIKIQKQKETILKKKQYLNFLMNELNNRTKSESQQQNYIIKIQNAKSNLEKLKMQIEDYNSFEMKIRNIQKMKDNESKNIGKNVFFLSMSVVIASYYTLYNFFN